jgi:hypothetical protein
MARCANCNEALPFTKVALLSKRKNIVECPHCHTILEGEEKQLATIGATTGGIGGLLGFLTVYSFLPNAGLAILFLLMTISAMLISAILQNQIIKLKPKNLDALQQKQ